MRPINEKKINNSQKKKKKEIKNLTAFNLWG